MASSHTDFVHIGQNAQCSENVHAITVGECNLHDAHDFIDFHDYLSCLGILSKADTCSDADCTLTAPRQELVGMATRIRNIPMKDNYVCQNIFSDVTGASVPGWTCQIAERAMESGLITTGREIFQPLQGATRAEAYATLMKSVCINISSEVVSNFPEDNTFDTWQKKVISAAMHRGLTSRNESTFDPNQPILMQELYVLSSRIIEWSQNNTTCPPIMPEVMCK